MGRICLLLYCCGIKLSWCAKGMATSNTEALRSQEHFGAGMEGRLKGLWVVLEHRSGSHA